MFLQALDRSIRVFEHSTLHKEILMNLFHLSNLMSIKKYRSSPFFFVNILFVKSDEV